MEAKLNVLGEELANCSDDTLTGSQGNDLTTLR